MRTDSQNRSERVEFFRQSEELHFDYCVKQGFMTPEERDVELRRLQEAVKKNTDSLLLKN